LCTFLFSSIPLASLISSSFWFNACDLSS
jgi:hypothetical protein